MWRSAERNNLRRCSGSIRLTANNDRPLDDPLAACRPPAARGRSSAALGPGGTGYEPGIVLNALRVQVLRHSLRQSASVTPCSPTTGPCHSFGDGSPGASRTSRSCASCGPACCPGSRGVPRHLLRPTRTYDEPAVKDVLREVHDDFAALRRLIVDEGVMTRDRASVYCRTHRTHEAPGQPAPG